MAETVGAVKLEDVAPGTVLARDVVDGGGGTLMATGQAVEARHLEALRRRGIREVYVATAAAERPDGGEVDARVARIERMFEEHEGVPLMMELRRIALAAVRATETEPRHG